jgi:hypothetical protein
MKRFSSIMLAAALVLAACSPSPGESPTEPAAQSSAETPIVPKNPLFGRWQLTRAQVAPWWNGEGEKPVADPALTTMEFQPGKSSGPPIATCDKAEYAVSLITPAGLFEGNLPDPFTQARMLGFLEKDVTLVRFSCASGGADVSLDFPMLDDNTVMLGLDNMIYTLTRTPD